MTDRRNFDDEYRIQIELYGESPSSYLSHWLAKYESRTTAQYALDLGCRNARFLARRGLHVTAIDASEVAIKRLKYTVEKEGLAIDAQCADVASIDLGVEKYDLIVANTILDHIDAEKGDRLLEGCIDALNFEGLIFVAAFTVKDPGARGATRASPTSGYIRRYFDVGELYDLLAEVEVLKYHEEWSLDDSHGPPHYHSIARALARKRE